MNDRKNNFIVNQSFDSKGRGGQRKHPRENIDKKNLHIPEKPLNMRYWNCGEVANQMVNCKKNIKFHRYRAPGKIIGMRNVLVKFNLCDFTSFDWIILILDALYYNLKMKNEMI